MEAREELRAGLERLEQAVLEAAEFFRKQPGKPAEAGAPWGPREVLAHMLFWHEWTCRNVEDALAGKAVRPNARPTEELNAEAIAACAGEPLSAMIDQLLALQRRLAAGLQTLPDPTVPVVIRLDGTIFTAAQRPGVMAQHFANHLNELRAK